MMGQMGQNSQTSQKSRNDWIGLFYHMGKMDQIAHQCQKCKMDKMDVGIVYIKGCTLIIYDLTDIKPHNSYR